MRLTECIRLGAMLGPQITGDFVSEDNSSCAIGAAFLAIGRTEEIENFEGIDWFPTAARRFPSLAIFPEPDPRRFPDIDTYILGSVGELIVYLNDHHGWTREKIADLIELKGWDCEAVVEAEPQPVPEQAAATCA